MENENVEKLISSMEKTFEPLTMLSNIANMGILPTCESDTRRNCKKNARDNTIAVPDVPPLSARNVSRSNILRECEGSLRGWHGPESFRRKGRGDYIAINMALVPALATTAANMDIISIFVAWV